MQGPQFQEGPGRRIPLGGRGVVRGGAGVGVRRQAVELLLPGGVDGVEAVGGRGEDAELGDPARAGAVCLWEAVLGRGDETGGEPGDRFVRGPGGCGPLLLGLLVGLVVVRPAAGIGVGLFVGRPRAVELLNPGEEAGQKLVGVWVGSVVLGGDGGYRACRTGADGAGGVDAGVLVRVFFARRRAACTRARTVSMRSRWDWTYVVAVTLLSVRRAL